MKRFIFLSIAWLSLSLNGWAELKLPALFSDHLILQRDRAVSIWGWASSGSEITVKFAGQEKTVKADPGGKWLVKLDAMPATAKGRTLTVISSSDKTQLSIQNVVVGEVWICSGQSNMAWLLKSSKDADLEIPAAHFPGLRLFTVTRKTAIQPQEDCEGAWAQCSPDSAAIFSAVAYYFGRQLHQTLKVPVGLINTSWGGTPSEAWTTQKAIAAHDSLQPLLTRWNLMVKNYDPKTAGNEYKAKLKVWEKKKAEAAAAGKPLPRRPRQIKNPEHHHHRPANLYNGMIAPLIPFAMRGAIWYQGESNQSRAYQYRTLFPTMIQNWREAWGQGDFPFYYVQIANFRDKVAEPGDSTWAEVREAQSMTMDKLKQVGQAVIIDIGMAKDIHPKNKEDVGKRLARWALHADYGMKEIVPSGPVYKSMTVNGDKVSLEFETFGNGLMAWDKQPLKGFAVAGEDKRFVWAQAVIKGGRIEVWSEQVAKPVSVRYGWADNPDGNLVNKVGLPASPFRTDDWPGLTVDEH